MSAIGPGQESDLADLADVILVLGRKLGLRGADSRGIVPLTGTESEVIREVHRTPRSTPTHVAEATGLRRSNVSVAIKVLESRDLLTREHPEGDARSVELVATEFAEENIDRIRAYWITRLREAPEAVLADCLRALDALRQLDENLSRGGDH